MTASSIDTLLGFTTPELVFPDLAGLDRDGVLRFFAREIARVHPDLDAETVLARLEEREALGSTGIGHSIAVPHCRAEAIQDAVIAVGVARRGIDFAALDGKPVRVFFVVVSAASEPKQNLRCLAAISSWAKRPENVERLVEARTREEILETLASSS